MGKLSEDFLAWLDQTLEPSDFKRKPPTSVTNIQHNLLVDIQLPLRLWLNFLTLHDFPYEGLSMKEVLAAILEMDEEGQECLQLQQFPEFLQSQVALSKL